MPLGSRGHPIATLWSKDGRGLVAQSYSVIGLWPSWEGQQTLREDLSFTMPSTDFRASVSPSGKHSSACLPHL